MRKNTKLYPEDQERVDSYLKEGYNDVERREFRPGMLLLVLFGILLIFSGISFLIARSVGVI